MKRILKIVAKTLIEYARIIAICCLRNRSNFLCFFRQNSICVLLDSGYFACDYQRYNDKVKNAGKQKD